MGDFWEDLRQDNAERKREMLQEAQMDERRLGELETSRAKRLIQANICCLYHIVIMDNKVSLDCSNNCDGKPYCQQFKDKFTEILNKGVGV